MNPGTIVLLVIIAITIAAMVALYFFGKKTQAKKEEQDELSIKNYDKARSHAMTYMHIVCFVIIIALQLIGTFLSDDLSIDVKGLLVPCFFLGIGIEYIITGLLFRKYERDGEECIY